MTFSQVRIAGLGTATSWSTRRADDLQFIVFDKRSREFGSSFRRFERPAFRKCGYTGLMTMLSSS